jgi:hypothetical protein
VVLSYLKKVFTVLALALVAVSAPVRSASACEITSVTTYFPHLGTHISYYCKATDAERKAAVEASKKYACVPEKLKESTLHYKIETHDMMPYWFTKKDAEESGPILDVRLVFDSEPYSDPEAGAGETFTGYRVLATGRKVTSPSAHIEYDLSEPLAFTRDCPQTGCTEKFEMLCKQ